ncbi:S1 family peptidase [Streptosporangium sp. NPDC050855]|uniref:S1 family peptidase n=1 Tax=Streptosporangium sp. NPDC050855 TaxID=3366194 RepID=UPI003788C3BC
MSTLGRPSMSHRHVIVTGCLLAATVLAPAAVPVAARPPAAQAAAAQAVTARIPAGPAGPAGPVGPPVTGAPSEGMLRALQRDLGLTREQVQARLLNETRLAPVEVKLRRRLGARFGGSWFTGKTAGALVVATTSAADIPAVVAAGARAEVVGASLYELTMLKRRLDAAMASHGHGGSVRYVDVRGNRIVVLSATPTATVNLAKAAGMDTEKVVVVASSERPRPLYDLKGGDPYYIGVTSRCSVGFAAIDATDPAERGFVSAGHCGEQGSLTNGFNRAPQGVFQGSSFPIDDYAWITVNENWTPTPAVDDGGGGVVPVAGARVAIEGASVCRSGSTSDFHCGVVRQRDASVTYPQGAVFGLTRTDACAEPGDSGGAFIAVDQAQGVTSGGSGGCGVGGVGGVTYFQPVGEILTTYGLALVTIAPVPPLAPDTCAGFPNTSTGTLATGRSAYLPRGPRYRRSVAGTRSACLKGPEGGDFDLYLQKWNGASWSTVATADGPAPDERITHTGTAGYYRYRVTATAGSGAYTLGFRAP